MEEKLEQVVEETTQPTESVDETKFDSAGDDSVIKIDLLIIIILYYGRKIRRSS